MLKKTIGNSGQRPANTREYGPKPQLTNSKPGNPKGERHLNGRPWTRAGSEQDR